MSDDFNYLPLLQQLQDNIVGSCATEQLKQAMQAYCDSWNSGDLITRRNLFAEDAVFNDPKNGHKLEGIVALTEFWQTSAAMPGSVHTVCHDLVACGDSGLMDFNIRFHNSDASVITLRVREVFAFNNQGKITAVDAYWDRNSIT